MGKIYVIIVELCLKLGLLPALKGHNSVVKMYNFRIKVKNNMFTAFVNYKTQLYDYLYCNMLVE